MDQLLSQGMDGSVFLFQGFLQHFSKDSILAIRSHFLLQLLRISHGFNLDFLFPWKRMLYLSSHELSDISAMRTVRISHKNRL